MAKFKNMKIAINEQQPLDEVMSILRNNGYIIDSMSRNPNVVVAWDFGTFDVINTDGWVDFNETFNDFKLTTLTELKEME